LVGRFGYRDTCLERQIVVHVEFLKLRVEESHFAFPISEIRTTLLIKPEEIMSVANRPAIVWEGEIIPMVYLYEVLGMNGSGHRDREETPVVVITQNNQLIAFAVDEYEDIQVMVMNRLSQHLDKVSNVAGTSIMGNGEVACVLNVSDLMDNAKIGAVRREVLSQTSTLPVPEQPVVKSVLVAEDSVMVRELERNILDPLATRLMLPAMVLKVSKRWNKKCMI